MALAANIDANFRPGRAHLESVPAGANHFGVRKVLGMQVLLCHSEDIIHISRLLASNLDSKRRGVKHIVEAGFRLDTIRRLYIIDPAS